jgi:hypothetical protein
MFVYDHKVQRDMLRYVGRYLDDERIGREHESVSLLVEVPRDGKDTV